MNTKIGHLVFNVRPENLAFYRDLLAALGWSTVYDGPTGDGPMLGVAQADGLSLWFGTKLNDTANDYDGAGLNHLAFNAESAADVDGAAAYLGARGVAMLFDTPRHRPEFSAGPEHTYYQIMFETPDRILVEIVYVGPKSA